MNTREQILEAVLKNQPELTRLPDTTIFEGDHTGLVEKYMEVFKTIGGSAFLVEDMNAVKTILRENFDFTKRIITTVRELADVAEVLSVTDDAHSWRMLNWQL